MSLEYHTGYCNNCQADHKLERKKPNHILHFLITVVLGIFTYGIGSVVWLCIWYVISVKFSEWRCHSCSSKDVIFSHIHLEHENKETKINLIDKLKKSSKILIVLLIVIIGIISFFSIDLSENDNSKNKKDKENIVNATINVQDESVTPKKELIKDTDVENPFCHLYNITKKSDSVSGFVSCKEGKLTVNFYDIEKRRVVDTKTVPFKNNQFYIKVDNLTKIDVKFSIKLTKEQIVEKLIQKEKEKKLSMPSIKYHNVETNNEEKETIPTQCALETWKYSKYSSEYLVIDGKTTCSNGKIVLDVFDENNKFLGTETDSIESGIFNVFLKTNSNPTILNLKYTISEK